MKNFSILLAMLFLAFTVEAQNVERTKRTKDRKSTKSSVRKTSGKSSKTKVAQVPSSSKSRVSKSSSLATRSSSNRNTKYSSDSPLSKSRDSRNNKVSSSSRASSSYASRARTSDAKRSSSSRAVRAASSSRSGRNTAAVVSGSRKNRSSSSIGSRNSTSKISSAASRKVYTSKSHRIKRFAPTMRHSYPSLDYRRVHNPYRKPLLSALYWDARMYRNYRLWYPDFNLWYYPSGYRIHTISAYDSYRYVGEVARIYGRVSEVYYSRETRQYYLYFGASFPYHDFTVILDARDANRYSWDPISYFSNRRLIVTGLVSLFDQKPELFIRKRSQIRLY